ncbi:SUKH-3 domain-containing protein [Herpetosiphon llansteffanensis]|uniref:SUKH-3 domain-containing protein n=1 Tax=Herpetosiphon llansteffanensis TaxID=2094568 RepID=UPI000D7C88D1|nr:SUKH-3 domain-containing protein [Herpetosiphon llansteffanensis]
MIKSIIDSLLIAAGWQPDAQMDPEPWLSELRQQQYPIFPQLIKLLRHYGGFQLNSATLAQPWQLDSSLEALFAWTDQPIEIQLLPQLAPALSEAAFWCSHAYVQLSGLQIAPIGRIKCPNQKESSLFILSNGQIMHEYHRKSLCLLGANLPLALHRLLQSFLLIQAISEEL